jgi:hypothetical protein
MKEDGEAAPKSSLTGSCTGEKSTWRGRNPQDTKPALTPGLLLKQSAGFHHLHLWWSLDKAFPISFQVMVQSEPDLKNEHRRCSDITGAFPEAHARQI